MLTSGALTARPRSPVPTLTRLKSLLARTPADGPTWETTLAALAVTAVPRLMTLTVGGAVLLIAWGPEGAPGGVNGLGVWGGRFTPALPEMVPSVPRSVVTSPRLFRAQADGR